MTQRWVASWNDPWLSAGFQSRAAPLTVTKELEKAQHRFLPRHFLYVMLQSANGEG